MTSADLAPLLGGEQSDVGFAQGTVVSWDEATGSNVVNVKGTNLVNLPALNIGEFAILQESDVVGLLRFKTSYFILGRIILPSGPDRNRASVDFGAAFGSESGFSVTTTATNRATATLTNIPDWVDEAIIMAGYYCQGWNTTAGAAYLSVSGQIDGNLGPTGQFLAPAASSGASGSMIDTQILVNPGSTINVHTRVNSTGANWGTDASNFASTQVIALYRRVD